MPANTVPPAVRQTTIEGRRLSLSPADDLIPAPRRPFNMVATVAKGGSANITLVTMQVVDADGVAVATGRPFHFDWYLSDDATNGAGLTATTASGAVAVGASGTDLISYVSKKAGRAQTDATGKYILSITDSAKTAFNVCVNFPMGFHHPGQILATLAAGDYD